MKMPTRNSKKKAARRLSPAEWVAAEELYRSGWTQAQVADKYGVRVETVSRHMTKRKVKGGERADAVREELAAALRKKQREFVEVQAARQVDAKEMLFKMNNALLGKYAREFKDVIDDGGSLAQLAGVAKALKDSVMALKISREEMYVILDVKDGSSEGTLPELNVSSMTVEEEDELRHRVTFNDDEDEDEAAAADMAEVIEAVDRTVEMANV